MEEIISVTKSKRIPRFSLIIWMIFVLSFWFVWGLFNDGDRSQNFSILAYWRPPWRMGLNPLQTVWDPTLFFGQIWFNLLVVIIIAGCWLYFIPVSQKSLWINNTKRIQKIFLINLGIVFILLISMLISDPLPSYIWSNWYPTQTTYLLPVLPSLLIGMILLISPMKKGIDNCSITEKDSIYKNRHNIVLRFAIIALILWFFMTIPTEWHPHGFFNLEIQFHYLILTFSVPMILVVFLSGFLVNFIPKKGDGQKYGSFAFIGFLVSLIALIVLNLVGAYITPYIRTQGVLTIDFAWWWFWAQWPSYLFIISLSFAVITGIYLLNDKKIPKMKFLTFSQIENLLAKSKVIPIIGIFMISLFILPPTIGIVRWIESQDKTVILINQVGYLPESPKNLFFQAKKGEIVPTTAIFEIYDTKNNQLMYTGLLNKEIERYGHWYMKGDFSNFTSNGSYYIRVDIDKTKYTSWNFDINPNVYDTLRRYSNDFFYYQRSGYDVEEIVPGFSAMPAGNLDDAMIWNGTTWVYKNLTGGWHDAGDYNKYNAWFQTEWFATQALAEVWMFSNDSFWQSQQDLYDSDAPDIFDEMLWGVAYLIKCVDTEGILPNSSGLIIDTVGGWKYAENTSGLMSYWGPAQYYTDNLINTGDERVVQSGHSREIHETYEGVGIPWGYKGAVRAYQIAGALLQCARALDNYLVNHPNYQMPSWAFNSSTIRNYVNLINATYAWRAPPMNQPSGNWEATTGYLLFSREQAYLSGNWTNFELWVNHTLSLSDYNPINQYWYKDNLFALILSSYLEANRTIPTHVLAKAQEYQDSYYSYYYQEPFMVKHYDDFHNGSLQLFRRRGWDDPPADEGNTEALTALYLQALISAILPTKARMDIIQAELDWVLGVNPLGLCQISGLGYKNVPQIHNRRQWSGDSSGHVPGGIINGIKRVMPNKDNPAYKNISQSEIWKMMPDEAMIDDWKNSELMYDGVNSNSNEIWIPHNAAFVKFLGIYFAFL